MIVDNENIWNDNSGDNALQYWTIKNIEAQHILILLGNTGNIGKQGKCEEEPELDMKPFRSRRSDGCDCQCILCSRLLTEKMPSVCGLFILSSPVTVLGKKNAQSLQLKVIKIIIYIKKKQKNWVSLWLRCKGNTFFFSLWLERMCLSFQRPTDVVSSVPAPLSRCYHYWFPSSNCSSLHNFWQSFVFVSGNHTLSHSCQIS